MEMQRFIHALPTPLRRHKLIRALAFIDPASRIQLIRFNGDAQAFIDVHEGNLRTVMIAGAFDPDYFRIARTFLRDGGSYFDIGANAGLCSFGLVPTCPRVHYHLFEANPQLWPLLHRSIALQIGVNLNLIEAAVGERTGSVQLEVHNEAHDIGRAFIRAGAGVQTRILTIDEYIGAAGISRVEFVKMDIEGYECFALAGARESVAAGKLPVVYFELVATLVARHGKSVAEVLDQFRAAGYSLFHVRDRPDTPVDAPWSHEVNGVAAAPVDHYPGSFASDLLAVHGSAKHVSVRRR